MDCKFSELHNGATFTSKIGGGNLYQKLTEDKCRIVDWNHDDDELMIELHIEFGGIAHNVYAQILDVDPCYEVVIQSRN